MNDKKNIITVVKNGVEINAEVIALFKVEEFDKKYILYTLGEMQDEKIKIRVSTYKKTENGCVFDNVETEAELEAVNAVVQDLAKKKNL